MKPFNIIDAIKHPDKIVSRGGFKIILRRYYFKDKQVKGTVENNSIVHTWNENGRHERLGMFLSDNEPDDSDLLINI